ncbi:MAG: outer membrane protein assembly factor BamA [Pseudomonadaceae bacterium]|nr:outer membrane protein assembly factor BamA [Pseudomonadaceae bacterium]
MSRFSIVSTARSLRVALRSVFAAALVAAVIVPTASAESFIVGDIRLQGLQRVSAGTVFNLLPVSVGDEADDLATRRLVRALFQSGYFNDIKLLREGNVLIVSVTERPAIESIEIDGNKAIPTEALLDGLSQQGLREGEIFKQATLERVGLELERQYVAQGRYGATIDTEINELPRNRVDIAINISEGKSSGIRHINIVGAQEFDQAELLDQLELQHPSFFSFYRNDDKYAREKLAGDLEKLESYYRDRGYVEFNVSATQVSITPDRRQVYISLQVEEGDIYTIEDVSLIGELNDIKPEALKSLFLVQGGQTYNQALVTATEERLTAALGNAGYTFATASGIPRVGEDGQVNVEFFVDAGNRAYVRRISFNGNQLTQDEVMRREMRQMEGGWASTSQIDLSKVRLERLGFFSTVDVETPEVAGSDDQIDVNFTVEEQPSGSISATLGFAQSFGLVLGASYQQNNVLGTGNSLGVGVNFSDFQKSANFNYFNPYFTLDGISRGFNLFFRETDFDQQNIARFATDSFGAGLNFGFPIGETQRLNFGLQVEQTKIKEGVFPALEISDFLAKNGDSALNYKLNGSWSSSTLNRGLFPTAGRQQTLFLELAVPGSDQEFFKISYQGQQYFPIRQGWSVRLRTELGYADSYQEGTQLPFYEHFFAGGFGSIRGFEQNTLGPRSTRSENDFFSDPEGDPFGGNLLIEASAELIFPVPFIEDNRQFRSAVFVDVGNVFDTACPRVSTNCIEFSADEFRYSVGMGVTWLTGLGPMTFAIAKPFNAGEFDEEETFQFELGTTF